MDTATTKRRIDAWDAALTEAQRWTVFYHMQRWTWAQAAEWAAKEYQLESVPSRSAMYRFYDSLQPLESDHRITSSIATGEAAAALAKTKTSDEVTIAAYDVMARDLSMLGNEDRALKYTTMAMKIAERQIKAVEIQIKHRDQELREREIAIKEATSKELAIDLLIKEAGKNELASALLKQFVETLDQA